MFRGLYEGTARSNNKETRVNQKQKRDTPTQSFIYRKFFVNNVHYVEECFVDIHQYSIQGLRKDDQEISVKFYIISFLHYINKLLLFWTQSKDKTHPFTKTTQNKIMLYLNTHSE